MIPTIEDIVASLLAGDMDGKEAIHWLNEHKKLAARVTTPASPSADDILAELVAAVEAESALYRSGVQSSESRRVKSEERRLVAWQAARDYLGRRGRG